MSWPIAFLLVFLFFIPPLLGWILLIILKQKRGNLSDLIEEKSKKAFTLKRESDQLVKAFANRILVVDDDPVVLKSISMILESSGYAVDTAELGEDALKKTSSKGYNAVLLDLALPDRHGYDVLRDLRKSDISTPVLIVTGTEHSPEVGFATGANDYISKPYRADELKARVGNAVRETFGVRSSKSKFHQIDVDFISREASFFGRKLNLSDEEFSIIEILSLRGNVPTSTDMVVEHLSLDGKREIDHDDIIRHFSSINDKLNFLTNGICSLWVDETGRVNSAPRQLM